MSKLNSNFSASHSHTLRHGSLYYSSASKNRQFTGFRKMSVNITLLNMTLRVINVLHFEENS